MLNDQYFDVGTSEKGKSDEDHLINGFRWSYDDFDHDETDFHLHIAPQIHKEEDDSKRDPLVVVVPDEHSETGDNDDSDGSHNRCSLKIKHKKPKRPRFKISSDVSSYNITREVPSVTQRASKRRRNEMTNKMCTLQQLLPNCHKTDKVSVLDKAIEYLRNLKLQLQVLSTMTMNPYFPPATLDFGIHNYLLTAMAITYGQNMTNQTTSSPLIPTSNWLLSPFTNLSFVPQASGQSPFLPKVSLLSSPQCLYGFVPYYSNFLDL